MFQGFGLVETSRVIRHGRTMVSKGYGFVKFSQPAQVGFEAEMPFCVDKCCHLRRRQGQWGPEARVQPAVAVRSAAPAERSS